MGNGVPVGHCGEESRFQSLACSARHRVRVALKMPNLSTIPQPKEGEMSLVTDQIMHVIMCKPDGLFEALVRECLGFTWIRSFVNLLA